MNIKRIIALTFDGRKDIELLGKLNSVAPYRHKKTHTLARDILMEALDEMIAADGITVDYSQGNQQ